MAARALMVIDMLRDFMEEGGSLYCGNGARAIIPFVARAVERMRRQGADIIFLTDWHDPDDPEFEVFGRHAVQGSRGAEIIDEIKPAPGDHIVRKTKYSGFHGTELDGLLHRLNPSEVYVTGVCTSICVMHTAAGLLDRGFRVHILAPGVADFDPEQHHFALKHLKIIGAHIDEALPA